ncbi:MAG TPA: hypothetical protein VIN08_28300 [Ohtaekwangia sp.]|uniref:hypothetical protein n=1 Tax=Ohtaekwangia sp. TaxID=2066019 RepID=UPI002F9259C4
MRKIIILIGILVAITGMFIAYSSQGHAQRIIHVRHEAHSAAMLPVIIYTIHRFK